MKNDISDDLIKKYLSGQATPEEASQVGDWMLQDSSNAALILKIESYLPHATTSENILRFKKEVRYKLNAKTPAQANSFLIYRLAATIAIILVFVTSLYFFIAQFNQRIWQEQTAHSNIQVFTLPDSSTITLNQKSSMKWNDAFNKSERGVIMNGEAFFDIAHNSQKPFVITIDQLKIKVLGTAFNVFEDEALNRVVVSVTRGKVLMMNGQVSLAVKAGMRGIYNKLNDTFLLETLSDTNDLAYATHLITFSEASFADVVKQLDKAYGITCIFDEKDFTNCRLTSSWSGKSLPFVLNLISEALNVEYKQEGNRVYFYGKGCL